MAAKVRRIVGPLLVMLGLLALSVGVFRHTALTNKVLARGDAFAYFTPYWAYRAEALREGRLPLWNPYLFLGVPFLANPQAAVLYPLHWPFIWLRPERALIWSLVLHTWLAGCFTYALARHLGLSRTGALAAALVYALGGHLAGHAGQINQINVLAWFPLALLLLDRTAHASAWRARLPSLAGLALALALQLLAGHTQATYISTAGLGAYALVGPLWEAIGRRRSARSLAGVLLTRLGLLATTVILAIMIAAAQLLPTMELASFSIRAGGLGFLETVAFSLKPSVLLLALLPPYGMQPEAAFGTPAFAEYLAYTGILGLVLAGLGLLPRPSAGRPDRPRTGVRAGGAIFRTGSSRPEHRRLSAPLAALAVGGLLLALGGYTPLYPVFYKVIPGFGLFRVPPRWLAWYALAVALLAGMGLDRLIAPDSLHLRACTARAWDWAMARRWRQVLAGVGSLLLAVLLLVQHWPGLITLAAWAGLALVAAGLLARERWPARLRPLVGPLALVVLGGELLTAALPLDFNHPSAPQAVTSLRTAPAHLLAASGRFLSMSGIRYDPGDLPEMRQLLTDDLDEPGFRDYVIAAKLKEIIAPNLPLLLHLPSIDGYDGGILPLARYSWFQTLFVTPDRLPSNEDRLPDGRLREQLQEIPASRMLDLAGVRYVITDKVRDVWVDGVYYDLQGRVALTPGQSFTLRDVPDFSATALGVISYLEPPFPPPASQTGEIWLEAEGERPIHLDVRADRDIAPGTASRTAARAVYHDDVWQVNYYQAILPLTRPVRPTTITLRSSLTAGNWVVRGVTLIDERTGQFAALVVSPDGRLRRVHSGDVKVYELAGSPGRAFVTGRARVIPDDKAAIAALADWSFDPRQEVILSAGEPLNGPATGGRARIVVDRPEEVVIEAVLDAPGYLVLNDTNYPGWQATVDGRAAPVLEANFLFRAVALTPGEHVVTFSYRPDALQRGVRFSAAGLVLTILLGLAGFSRRPRNVPVAKRKR